MTILQTMKNQTLVRVKNEYERILKLLPESQKRLLKRTVSGNAKN